MHESTQVFQHRAKIIRQGELPVCADCGSPSTVELVEVTQFGDSVPTFIEVAALECPNGPHVQLVVKNDSDAAPQDAQEGP